jgi:hypothetical protein
MWFFHFISTIKSIFQIQSKSNCLLSQKKFFKFFEKMTFQEIKQFGISKKLCLNEHSDLALESSNWCFQKCRQHSYTRRLLFGVGIPFRFLTLLFKVIELICWFYGFDLDKYFSDLVEKSKQRKSQHQD